MALEVGKIYIYTSENYPLEIYRVTHMQNLFYNIQTLVGTFKGPILRAGNIQANSTLFETSATTLEELQDLHPELFI